MKRLKPKAALSAMLCACTMLLCGCEDRERANYIANDILVQMGELDASALETPAASCEPTPEFTPEDEVEEAPAQDSAAIPSGSPAPSISLDPDESTEPAQSAAPTDSSESAQSSAPTDSTEPALSVAPDESAELALSPVHTESAEPTQAAAPIDSTAPTKSIAPCESPEVTASPAPSVEATCQTPVESDPAEEPTPPPEQPS